MCVTLTIGVLLVMREASALDGKSRAASAIGGLAILTTAIFPEAFTTDATANSRMLYVLYLLHVGGLGTCMVLLIFVPYVRVCCATYRMPRRARLRALLPRTLHLAALMGYGYSFALLRLIHGPDGPEVQTDVSDYCSPITPELFALTHGVGPGAAAMAQAACNGWPDVSEDTCTALTNGTIGLSSTLHGSPLPVRYTCAYINETLTHAQAALHQPEYVSLHQGGCYKSTCKLLVNARSIALEFGMLFLFGAYITAYLRVDLAWVTSVNSASSSRAAAIHEQQQRASEWQPSSEWRPPNGNAPLLEPGLFCGAALMRRRRPRRAVAPRRGRCRTGSVCPIVRLLFFEERIKHRTSTTQLSQTVASS